MAVSYLFRSTSRPRSSNRLQRRWNVGLFVFSLAIALIEGGSPLRVHTFLSRTLPWITISAYLLLFDRPAKRDGVYVTSLDDRAMFKYGAEYEALAPEQQKDILDHYRVGTYVFPRPEGRAGKPDSRQYVRQAFRLYRWSAVPLALVYAAGWRWLPDGFVRIAWTNVPVVAAVLLATALALPTMLKQWSESD